MRTDKELITDIATLCGLPAICAVWSGVDVLLPLLEKMKAEGAIVILKLDGERKAGDNGAYTAIVSGAPLKGDFIRTDAGTPEEALAYVIVKYAEREWKFTYPN